MLIFHNVIEDLKKDILGKVDKFQQKKLSTIEIMIDEIQVDIYFRTKSSN